jgi:hypothetical protein
MSDYTVIAEVDESPSYEVDMAEVRLLPDGTFVLATADDCSCWSGEWDEETYATYIELEAALSLWGTERTYNPSPAGSADLLAQVRAWFAKGTN